MSMVDLVIDDVSLVTMDASRAILHDAFISVQGRKIHSLGTGPPPPARRLIAGRGGVVMPGMISTHQHVIDVLLRGGLEQDRSLFDWLVNVYFAGTSAYTPADCVLGATLGLSEAVRAGITTIVDNWGVNNGDDPARVDECAEATLEVYRDYGLRILFARMFSDCVPEQWSGVIATQMRKLPRKTLSLRTLSEPVDDALGRIESLIGRHNNTAEGRLRICPAPIMAQLVSPEGLAGAQQLASHYDTIVAFHHCESPLNARMFTESGAGLSATDYLNALGFLGPRTLAAHCVWIDDRDIRLLSGADVKVSHCPSCNMFLGSGAAPVPRLLASGVTVGLGTDDANTSSNISIMLEMRQAALLAKLVNADAGALTAEKALEMATIDGAHAIGLAQTTGSLEPGKRADLVLLDRGGPHWHPTHHLPATIVYQAHGSDVRTVLVDGRPVLDDGKIAFAPASDPVRLHAQAQQASEAIVDRAGIQQLRARGWQRYSRT